MKNKFLLGLVSFAAVSCFSSSSVDLLKKANSNWEAFKNVSEPVLKSNDNTSTAAIKAVKKAIQDLDNVEYTDVDLDDHANEFVKAFNDAKEAINTLKKDLYSQMDNAWAQYSNAAKEYIASLPGNSNKKPN